MHFGQGPTRQKKSTKEDSLKTGKVSINCFLMWHETAFQMWPPDSLVDHSIVNYDSNLLENATKNPKSRAAQDRPPHSGSKWLKPAIIKFHTVQE